MLLFNDPLSDHRTDKPIPGSYEWWYFDACSHDGRTAVVAIFYDGNPFSRRYITDLESGGSPAASGYPAVSVSVYHDGKPVYYAFLEHPAERLIFTRTPLSVQIGSDGFSAHWDGSRLEYRLSLDQTLPGGHALKGTLAFSSPLGKSEEGSAHVPLPGTHTRPGSGQVADGAGRDKADGAAPSDSAAHSWNLVQSRADVSGELTVRLPGRSGVRNYAMDGLGYHDHNIGREPMRDSFKEWYWGRFHGEGCTFLYYLMIRQDGTRDTRNWLIADGEVHRFGRIEERRHGSTLFRLRPARTLRFDQPTSGRFGSLDLSLGRPVDSGPFYLRYLPRLTLQRGGNTGVDAIHLHGVAEYIRPGRIHDRRFWPLVDMRIRYLSEPVHWVQRSGLLYRLTW